MNDIVLEGEFTPLSTDYSNRFSGVFDGNGYTISNLTINESKESLLGLFGFNSGTIKNLNVKTSEKGINCTHTGGYYVGIIVGYNYYGEISDCNVSGNISVTGNGNQITASIVYAGGIAGYDEGGKYNNVSVDADISAFAYSRTFSGGIVGKLMRNGEINHAAVRGNIELAPSSSEGYVGGIVGNCSSSNKISNSYFIGNLVRNCEAGYYLGVGSLTFHSGGISSSASGSTYYSAPMITNCYAVATHSNFTSTAGVTTYFPPTSGEMLSPIVTNCFYDEKVSGLTDSDYGTPTSTVLMKTKRYYTDAGWDFDTIWAIDEDHNDGYPHLQFETADENITDYTINSIKVLSKNDEELSAIPETENFFAEISVTKNTNRNEKDTVIIAKYDVNGKLIGITYMKSLYEKKQEVTFGTLIENNGVSYIKAFVWDSLSGMAPLSNVCEF